MPEIKRYQQYEGSERFKLMEPKEETPQGQWFHALDERTGTPVDVLFFNREILSDATFLGMLRTQTELARSASHALLRAVYSLEETVGRAFLVEDAELGISLQDVLRSRQQLAPSEVAILLARLASLADHAQRQGLSLVDLTLRGIHLDSSAEAGYATTPLERRLDSWKTLELKVDPIDLSLIASGSGTSVGAATWQGQVTLLNLASATGPRSSYLRLLSLLGYELLGGQRDQVETSGRMSPLAEIDEEANLILRRGAVDEYGSAAEMANAFQQALTVAADSGPPTRDSTSRGPRSPGSSTALPVGRPATDSQPTVVPPVLPPPLPTTVFSTAGSTRNLSGSSIPRHHARQTESRTTRPIWQSAAVWICAALFLALCLGAFACYFTIQQLVKIVAEKNGQEQLPKKENEGNKDKPLEDQITKPSETEKTQGSLARTLIVPDQYSGIQAAIDAAKAGDTVVVRAGVYNEKLKFKDGIELKGENPQTTIVRYAAAPTAVTGQSSYDAPLEVRNCRTGQVEQLSFEQTGADLRPSTGSSNLWKIDAIIVLDSSIVIKNCRAGSLAACGIDISGAGSAPALIENQCRFSVVAGICLRTAHRGAPRIIFVSKIKRMGFWSLERVPADTNEQ